MYKIPANTLFIGQQLVFVPECHSTNKEVQQLIQLNSATDGVVLITDRQTKGRGQRGNTWESEPGKNLTFSIGIRPHFLEAKDQFYLNIAVSLGLHDHLVSLLKDADVKIKWPNDMMVNGRKICGILIENSVLGDWIQHSVIGIGLNVNQRMFKAASATSLAVITGQEFNMPEMLENLLGRLESRYLQLRSTKIESLKRDYLEALFWRGDRNSFESGNVQFEGIIVGIDSKGRLAIQVDNRLEYFDHKEVRYVA